MDVDKVAILVKKAALEFDKVANTVLAPYDLTSSQYKVLRFLYARPTRSARVVDIEQCFSLTHPTAIGILDKLEAKGFVERHPNPQDARSRIALLTPRADALQSELDCLGDQIEDQLTSPLTQREHERLIKLLKKLLGEG